MRAANLVRLIRNQHVWLWFWLILGIVVRAAYLGAASLWMDEGYTYHLSRLPFGSLSDLRNSVELNTSMLATLYRLDAHPPLFYVLLKGWILMAWHGAGEPPEWFLRIPSALSSIGSLWILNLLSRRLLTPPAADAALAVASFSQASVWMGQEVRMYPLLGLLVVCGAWGAVVGLLDHRRSGLVMWTVCSVLGCYTHYLGILAPLATWGWMWGLRRTPTGGEPQVLARSRTRSVRPWIAAGVLVGVLYLPWVAVLAHHVLEGHGPPR